MESFWLPDEIWEQIFFSYDFSPKDTSNCFIVSSNWRRIISAKLDPLIVLLAEVIPLVGKYVHQRDILRYRLVCRQWKNIIDTCCKPYWFDYNAKLITNVAGVITLKLKYSSHVKAFLSAMENQSENPIPLGGLILNTNFHSSEVDFYKLISSLGERFGRHILHLGCFVEIYPPKLDELFLIFYKLPNLKTLYILKDYSNFDDCKNPNSFQDAEELKVWSTFNLNVFENLETFKCICLSNNVLSWLPEILKRVGPRLTKLALNILPALCPGESRQRNCIFALVPQTVTDFNIGWLSLEQGLSFNIQEIPLSSLSVLIYMDKRDMKNNMREFLQCFLKLLKRFGGTLKKLDFAFGTGPPFLVNGLTDNLERNEGLHCNLGKLPPSRKCVCNNFLDNNPIPEFGRMGKQHCDSLRVLSLPHFFLHPRLFPRVMDICRKIREFNANDIHRACNFEMSWNPESLIERLFDVEKIIKDFSQETPASLEIIRVEKWCKLNSLLCFFKNPQSREWDLQRKNLEFIDWNLKNKLFKQLAARASVQTTVSTFTSVSNSTSVFSLDATPTGCCSQC